MNKIIKLIKEKRRKDILSKPLPKYKKIFLMLPKKGKFLDAGCGNANLSKYLLFKNPNLKIIGCDINKFIKYNHANFIYFNKNLNRGFSFKRKFDVIIFADVLEHLKNPEKILEQASKYTNQFILSIPNLEFFVYKLFPKLENPPKKESQHLHHWKYFQFIKILPKNFKIVKKEYCSDFPEFRWFNELFPKSSFFNQTLIIGLVKK